MNSGASLKIRPGVEIISAAALQQCIAEALQVVIEGPNAPRNGVADKSKKDKALHVECLVFLSGFE
jgi:hypothetical protein